MPPTCGSYFSFDPMVPGRNSNSAPARFWNRLLLTLHVACLGLFKAQQVGYVASRRKMLGTHALESVLLVQRNRRGKHRIGFQPDLSKPALTGGCKQILDEPFSQPLPASRVLEIHLAKLRPTGIHGA